MTTKRAVACAIAFAVLVAACLVAGWASPQKAEALSGAQFDPGNIISDQNFYDSGAMSQAQIQAFLTGNLPSCQNSNCLATARFDSSSRAADPMCAAYAGAAGETVAAIIFKVQRACAISAKVILVTLQKEQGLVTNPAPTASRIQTAMGYACPDTASCDTNYYGFFNQVYSAAHQLKRYGNPPGTSNFFTWLPVGSSAPVKYNPNAGCGAPLVNIQNKATAALYYYTPYQPNAAALANLYGVGDGCSSYGNRNFWVYYNQWFGSPTAVVDPMASLDDVAVQYKDAGASILVSGWAIERTAPATTALVDVYIDQPDGTTRGYEIKANTSRPDVGAIYTAAGPSHGYLSSFPATSPGAYRVCVFPMTGGSGGWLLGCRSITVAGVAATGSLDSVVTGATATGATITAGGWGFDQAVPTSTSTATLTVTDPRGGTTTASAAASAARPDVAAAYPAAGGAHGFSLQVAVNGPLAGQYRACVTVTGHAAVGKTTSTVGCQTVSLLASDPVGVLDYGTVSLGADGRSSITFGGWALDRSWLSTSIPVDVYIDRPNGTTFAQRVASTGTRNDIGRLFPGAGTAHGFTGSMPVSAPGSYRLCAFGIGASAFGQQNILIGCQTVSVLQVSPIGSLDGFSYSISGGKPTLTASGWSLDQGAPGVSIPVDLYLDQPDGTVQSIRTASTGARSDIANAFPGMGSAHGFVQNFTITKPGAYRLCAYGIAQSTFNRGNAVIGCRSLTVAASAPIGAFDSAAVTGSAGAYSISANGWSADPAVPTTVSSVTLTLDKPDKTTVSMQVAASGTRNDVARAFPALGPAHGFTGSFTALTQSGSYRVCASGLPASPFGSATLLGCRQVTLP